METILLVLFSLLLLLLTAAVIHTVNNDGRGHLPPVRSHHDWNETGAGTSFTSLRDYRDLSGGLPYTPPFR